jgi:hypothetical protein
MNNFIKVSLVLFAVGIIYFADVAAEEMYTVVKLQQPVEINAVWDKEPWNSVQELTLSYYMGEKPTHFPTVNAKVAYDDEAVYVIFKVRDKYVIATASDYLGQVWRDSCVEFFFTPDDDSQKGYFNFEMNCGGTVYFQFQTAPGKNEVQISKTDFDKITIAHTMPEIVYPEITDSVTWCVEYRMPISIFEKYFQITKPAPGKIWRANFNKCADQCSHPHWLTWAKIDFPTPAFHKPGYFGVLKFSDSSLGALESPQQPASFQLEQNYPNPFNPKTAISYSNAAPNNLSLRVFDIKGALVRTLFNCFHDAGEYQVLFDGSGLSGGCYFYQLTDGSDLMTHRMFLVK